MMGIPCQKCKEKAAMIKLTKIENGQPAEFNLCQDCAEEMSLIKHKKIDEIKLALTDILSGILESEKASKDDVKIHKVGLICRNCGMSFETFKNTFLLGCPKCYESFREKLIPIIRKIHGSVKHVGKVPEREIEAMKYKEQIKGLRNELDTAVEHEDYKLAAQIRDKIDILEQKTL